MKNNKLKMCMNDLTRIFVILVLFFSQISSSFATLQFMSQNKIYQESDFNSEFIDGTTNIRALPNEIIDAYFIFKNTGKEMWGSVENKNPVFLGIYHDENFFDYSNNFKNWGWSNESRIRMSDQFFNKDLGQYIAIFGCQIMAPNKPGQYVNTMKLVVENDEYSSFFGDKIELIINITSPEEAVKESNDQINSDTGVISIAEADFSLPDNKNSTLSEIQRISEARNEVINYEKELEERLKKLNEKNIEMEERMQNTINSEEKAQILQEILIAKKEQERLSSHLEILQEKMNKDDDLLSANLSERFKEYTLKNEKNDSSLLKVILLSLSVFLMTFFFFEYMFSRNSKTKKSLKNDEKN